MDCDVTVRRARPGEVATVLSVLDDAAAWLAHRGVGRWPPAFRAEVVEPALGEGRVWLAEAGGAAVATLTLDGTDPLWPDDGRALYLHRFAVTRGRAGLGAGLLAWTAAETRRRGRDLLRLDCGADNPRLRAYYEAAGFAHRGDVRIPASAVTWSAGRPLVSRYELAVTAAG